MLTILLASNAFRLWLIQTDRERELGLRTPFNLFQVTPGMNSLNLEFGGTSQVKKLALPTPHLDIGVCKPRAEKSVSSTSSLKAFI